MKREDKIYTIYIRTSGSVLTLALSYPTHTIYKDYDLNKKDRQYKDNFNTIIKSHRTWPINIMYEDMRKIRSWFEK